MIRVYTSQLASCRLVVESVDCRIDFRSICPRFLLSTSPCSSSWIGDWLLLLLLSFNSFGLSGLFSLSTIRLFWLCCFSLINSSDFWLSWCVPWIQLLCAPQFVVVPSVSLMHRSSDLGAALLGCWRCSPLYQLFRLGAFCWWRDFGCDDISPQCVSSLRGIMDSVWVDCALWVAIQSQHWMVGQKVDL